KRSSTRGCNNFIAIERKYRNIPENTYFFLLIHGTESLSRIFDQRYFKTPGHCRYLFDFGRHAIDVDVDNSLRLFASTYAPLDGIFQAIGVHIPGLRFAIHKHRHGTLVQNRVHGGDEGKRLANHKIISPYTECGQGEVYGRSAAVSE